MANERERLRALVQSQAAERACWERAEAHLVEGSLRERLAALSIVASSDLGVALMAVAMVLAERSPEFGGDYRDALGDVALVGLGLLGDDGT